VISHDAYNEENIVRLGLNRYRTLVSVNRDYFNANLKLVVGGVEPHQFAGYSGGVKTAAIGLAGLDTINANHKMMSQEHAEMGRYDDNPVRMDIEDLGRVMRVDVALNVVMNSHKQIVQAFCGVPLEVMRKAVPVAREVYEVPVTQAYDLVVASPGGHPKDLNVYQAQKALGHAVRISKVGGTIIIAAACSEGAGSDKYQAWLQALPATDRTHQRVIDLFNSQPFKVGPHKAFQLARDSVRRRVIWITDLPRPDFFLMESAPSLSAALSRVEGSGPVAVMPYANSTIPFVK
jgi:lactate racemase